MSFSEATANENAQASEATDPFWLRLYTVKTHLTKDSLLLHIRFLVGSKKERTDIILGCFDAHVERMLRPRQRDPPAP